MKFPKPKKKNNYPLNLSLEVIHIVQQYAKYCNKTVEEVVEFMLIQLLENQDFVEYINKKKDNKKMLEILNNYGN